MARLIYACRFEVPTSAGSDDVLEIYREWLTEHYRKRRHIAEFNFDLALPGEASNLPANHSLSSVVYESSAGQVVRIRWSFPAEDDPGLRWLNEVRVGTIGNRNSVEHLISVESVEYNVAPARLPFGSPRVIRDICTRTQIYVGEMRVRATPYVLQQGGLGDLLALLTSGLRRLPIVMLSPYVRGEPNLIDAGALAKKLAGVAVVVRIDDSDVTWEFADEVGRQLSCFNGAARIYWPGFSKDSDPRNYRLFFGAWIEHVGPAAASRAIERAVFAVATFRFVPDQRIADIVRSAETEQRQRQLSEKKAAGDDFWKDYERDLARLDDAEAKICELEAENANLKANQQVFISGALLPEEPEDKISDEHISLSSVREAVQAAAQRSGNLEILESACSSAAESPFQRPFDVFKALRDLDDIVDAWRAQRLERGSGGDFVQHLRDRGWGKRSSMHISDTTRGKYRAHYEFEYQGTRQLFEPHITIGAGAPNSCASIHFIFDAAREKVVVGHVGKHLPNTKT